MLCRKVFQYTSYLMLSMDMLCSIIAYADLGATEVLDDALIMPLA